MARKLRTTVHYHERDGSGTKVYGPDDDLPTEVEQDLAEQGSDVFVKALKENTTVRYDGLEATFRSGTTDGDIARGDSPWALTQGVIPNDAWEVVGAKGEARPDAKPDDKNAPRK